MKQTIIFILPLFFVIQSSFGQNGRPALTKKMADSIGRVFLDSIAIEQPLLRQAFMSVDAIGKGDITARLDGKELFKAKEQRTQVSANFNIPVAKWGLNNLTASFGYFYQQTQLSQVTNDDPQLLLANTTINTSMISFSAAYTKMCRVFNKQVLFSAILTGLTDAQFTQGRINGLVGINVPLIRTSTSYFSAGVYFINDPALPINVLPLITYSHRFQSSGMVFIADIPRRVLIKKELWKNKGWLSLGTELTGTELFLSLQQPLPPHSVNSTFDLKNGITLECLVTKKLILGVSGGVYSTLTSRLFKQGDTQKDYFMRATDGSVPYGSFSISFLPFLR